jgi:hypothetical protein
MANKAYAFTADSAAAQAGADYNKKSDQNSFITKPYSLDTGSSVRDADSKSNFATSSAYTPSATGYDKNFATSTADAGQSQASVLASSTAAEQGRAAELGGQTTSTYASPMGDKIFNGDEAAASKRHLTRLKTGQMLVEELPDRPLTIDEVRDLLNHGFKADTDVKPQGEPSKALDDPDYKPQPLRDTPNPTVPASDEDKDDPVPPPGTMSAPLAPPPENAQSLPQR